MKRRKHRDTVRLTALERAIEVAAPWERLYPANGHVLRNAIERALQAHARQALARERLRDKAYPGQGDPWGDFLHYRALLLDSWARHGKSPVASAHDLSMNAVQVGLIVGRAKDRR